MSESTNTLKSIEFTWKITNFSQQKLKNGPGKWIRSRAFCVGCEGDLKFTLGCYPQGDVQSDDTEETAVGKWSSLFLDTECSKKYINCHFIEFSILDADGDKFDRHHFHKTIPFKSWGFEKFILLTDLENPVNNLLPNDTLTICCRVEETDEPEKEECDCEEEHPQTADNRRKLCEDLASLLDDKNADFVFKVENEEIFAHKAILTARSPVFAAMFQHDMRENKTNEAEVTDVTPAAFKALLQFIYTGHCEVGVLA
jgi:speckle-type POZ protein